VGIGGEGGRVHLAMVGHDLGIDDGQVRLKMAESF
jgi:hypothetical protein